MRARNTRACAYARKTSPSPPYLLHVLPQSVALPFSPLHEHCPKRYIAMPAHRAKNQHTDTSQHFFTVNLLVFNPNRSLDPE